MPTYVLDTSVVVKWFHQKQEAHTQKALQILQDLNNRKTVIIVPNIVVVELLNAFVKGKKSKKEEISEALKTFFKLPLIMKEPTLQLMEETNKITQQYNMTSYDALFLALAQVEDCQLISDDTKTHGKITDGSVIMLKDYR